LLAGQGTSGFLHSYHCIQGTKPTRSSRRSQPGPLFWKRSICFQNTIPVDPEDRPPIRPACGIPRRNLSPLLLFVGTEGDLEDKRFLETSLGFGRRIANKKKQQSTGHGLFNMDDSF
jgi:hypothetical protein